MKKVWKEKITVHCLIKDEERWIWYALNSVLDWVDKILIFDTGSTDKTKNIIKTIKSLKIVFEEKGEIDPKEYVVLRQKMIERTKKDWILILDGDEVWTEEAIRELREGVEKAEKKIHMVAVRYWNCLGDIFHYDEEYEKKKCPFGPKGMSGWWAGRGFRRNTPGLHVTGLYGFEGFADKSGRQISELGDDKILFLKNRFFHTTHLLRSRNDSLVMQRAKKRRYELGKAFDESVIYPKVFHLPRPAIVSSPFRKLSFQDRLKGFFINPWVKIRTALWRRIVYPKIKKAIREGVSDEELAKQVGIKLEK